MTAIKEVKIATKNMFANSNEVRVHQKTEKTTKLTKITGTLTSPIQLRDAYYYSFIRLKGQSIDLPVIFKTKNKEINLKKSDEVELTGNYSNSNKNIRKSFTATSYHLFSEKRIRKKHSDPNQAKTETNISTNHA